jgi:hypothetical protein
MSASDGNAANGNGNNGNDANAPMPMFQMSNAVSTDMPCIK